jgi:hypothetical protein
MVKTSKYLKICLSPLEAMHGVILPFFGKVHAHDVGRVLASTPIRHQALFVDFCHVLFSAWVADIQQHVAVLARAALSAGLHLYQALRHIYCASSLLQSQGIRCVEACDLPAWYRRYDGEQLMLLHELAISSVWEGIYFKCMYT